MLSAPECVNLPPDAVSSTVSWIAYLPRQQETTGVGIGMQQGSCQAFHVCCRSCEMF